MISAVAGRGYKRCSCTNLFDDAMSVCPRCGDPEWACENIKHNPLMWIYDVETYPNIFTLAAKHCLTGHRMLFEISEWVNDYDYLIEWLRALAESKCKMIGFNNVFFDYTIIHHIMTGVTLTADQIYSICVNLIDSNDPIKIWENQHLIRQIDLMKLHHFDGKNSRVGLKHCEFAMRVDNLSDLPYTPGSILNHEQRCVLIDYNHEDVYNTERLYLRSLNNLDFRYNLMGEFGSEVINYNDTAIGKKRLVNTLNASGTTCNKYTQSPRMELRLSDVIFPYVSFTHLSNSNALVKLKNSVINTLDDDGFLILKGALESTSTIINNFKIKFGLGGIHGSCDPQIITSNSDLMISDIDVKSFYPLLAAINKLRPEHLGDKFPGILKNIVDERDKCEKGTLENEILKLSANGAWGDSNNRHGPFYDPKYTIAVTVNGQLLLTMLMESLSNLKGLKFIQANTDGVTISHHPNQLNEVMSICKTWENFTLLELKIIQYDKFFIRDVNNYIAKFTNSKIKRVGVYEYELPLRKDHSALVIKKAAEAFLLHGQCITDFITSHDDDFDFMLFAKVSGAAKLRLNGVEIQSKSRYFISNTGGKLSVKRPPPKGRIIGVWKRRSGISNEYYAAVRASLHNSAGDLDAEGFAWDDRINTKNKSKYNNVVSGINPNYFTSICNYTSDFNRVNLNYDFYIKKAQELIDPLI